MNLVEMDAALFEAIYGIDSIPVWLSAGVTHLATKGVVLILATLVLLVFGRGMARRTGVALLCGLILHVLLIEGVLKHLVARIRPWKTLGVVLRDGLLNPDSYSHPSGHAVAAFLCAWVLGYRYPGWRFPMLGVAVLIALSRVHLGAHYPLDVTAGAMFGVAGGILLIHGFGLEPAGAESEGGKLEMESAE